MLIHSYADFKCRTLTNKRFIIRSDQTLQTVYLFFFFFQCARSFAYELLPGTLTAGHPTKLEEFRINNNFIFIYYPPISRKNQGAYLTLNYKSLVPNVPIFLICTQLKRAIIVTVS